MIKYSTPAIVDFARRLHANPPLTVDEGLERLTEALRIADEVESHQRASILEAAHLIAQKVAQADPSSDFTYDVERQLKDARLVAKSFRVAEKLFGESAHG